MLGWSQREFWAVTMLLGLSFLPRVWYPNQPIVENYVGRQIPTAMVARNLDRGGNWLQPQLDTAPFPNLFLVEPPLYELTVVGVRRLTGLSLEVSGRVVSALGYTLGVWGFFGLCRRRSGLRVALFGALALSAFPVGLRYGRAFQPDALMFGLTLAGLRCWDQAEHRSERQVARARVERVSGWVLLALGLALKILSAFLLVPLLWGISTRRSRGAILIALTLLVPGLLWYVLVAVELAWIGPTGSRATLDNGTIWLNTLGWTALLRAETYYWLARFLLWRAFTPIAFLLGLIGLLTWPAGRDRDLWRSWAGAGLVLLLAVAGKLHHEYYWLLIAAPMAAAVGRLLAGGDDPEGRRWIGVARWGALTGFLVLAGLQSWSTWRTPTEWIGLTDAAGTISATVPSGEGLVAREAVLYYSERRGCRLEIDSVAARRAAGEWGVRLDARDPLALLELYRVRGARFVADLIPASMDPDRRRVHAAIRQRYRVLVDRPGLLVARLTPRTPDAQEEEVADVRR